MCPACAGFVIITTFIARPFIRRAQHRAQRRRTEALNWRLK
jgi:hypothetical protein